MVTYQQSEHHSHWLYIFDLKHIVVFFFYVEISNTNGEIECIECVYACIHIHKYGYIHMRPKTIIIIYNKN